MFREIDYRYHWLRLAFGVDFLESDQNITRETRDLLYRDLEQIQDLIDYSKAEIIEVEGKENTLNVRIDGVKYRLKGKDLPGHILLSAGFMELFEEDKSTLEKIED